MRVMCVRMPETLIEDLKKLSAAESARRSKKVTWSDLVRESAREAVKLAGRRSHR